MFSTHDKVRTVIGLNTWMALCLDKNATTTGILIENGEWRVHFVGVRHAMDAGEQKPVDTGKGARRAGARAAARALPC